MHIAQFYREVLGVTDESILELLMENSKLIVFEKGQHLIHADEVVTELYCSGAFFSTPRGGR